MLSIVVGGAIVAAIVAAVAVAPSLIPLDPLKGQIEARVRAATGRDVTISGPLTLDLFPDVHVKAGGVTIANPPGAESGTMAKLPELDLSVHLIPLLSGRVEIEHLTLVDPTVALEIDARGRPNWRVVGPGTSSSSGLAALSRLDIKDVTIRNGTIAVLDRRTGEREELTNVALTLSLPRLGDAFTADGSEVWRGEKIAFAIKLDHPEMLARQSGRSGLTVSLTAKPVTVHLTGGVINAMSGPTLAPIVDGKADIAMPSLRDFIRWSGRDIALPPRGFGALSLSGAVRAQNGVAQFTDAVLTLDAVTATGTLTVDAGAATPTIAGTLRTGMLDLDPYLPPPAAGWSTRTFGTAIFRQLDAELTIAADGVKFRKLQTGKAEAAIALKGGKLALDIRQVSLYRGEAKGRATLDADGAAAAVTLDGTVSGVDLGVLLRDAGAGAGIAGIGGFTLTGAARGNSERDLIATLSGTASFRAADGAIGGVDLGGMLKNSSAAFTGGGGTPIRRAGGSFVIRDGIMRTGDLSVSAGGIDATGAGTVDLPKRTLDLRLEPRLIAGIVTVPVIVSGPWDRPSYAPDVAGIAKSIVAMPVRTLGGAAGLGGKVGQGIGSGVGATMKNLFGN
jgi:AsmA protein